MSSEARQTDGAAPRPGGLWQNVAVLGFGLGLAFAACEVVARMFITAPLPWRYPQLRYRKDPDLVFALVPGQESFTADKPVTINALGLRGPAVPEARTPGKRRLLFLGDSITFGYGVNDPEVVSTRTQALLAERGVSTEVINTAVPAYNTEQEVRYFERDGVRWHPDWVIVGFCWNDLNAKSAVQVSPEGWLFDAPPGETERKVDTLTRLGESPTGYAIRNLFKRSRFLYGATQRWRSVQAMRSPDADTQFRTDVLTDVLDGHDTPRVSDGWGRVQAALHRLQAAAAAAGARTLLVAFPVPLRLELPSPGERYPARLAAIAAAEGVPLLDLEPTFRAAFHGHESLFIPYDGDHPNAAGHEIAAQALVARLLAERGPGQL